MDKNLITAVLLSMGVYVAWFGFIEKRYFPQPQRPIPQRTSISADKPAAAQAPQAAAPAQEPAPAPSREQLEKSAFALDLGGPRAKAGPVGGGIVSYQFRGPLGEVELISNPVPGFFSTFPELSFSPEKGAPAALAAKRADGLTVRKEFVPGQGSGLPLMRVTLANAGKKPLETGPWALSVGPGLGTVQSEQKENEGVWRALGLTHEGGGSIEVFKPGDRPLAHKWVAVDNRYFLAAVAPPAGPVAAIKTSMPPQVIVNFKSVALTPGGRTEIEIPYYIGAKGHTRLRPFGLGLERSIDFGYFAQLGRPMLQFLSRLHDWTGNWGWSIILLTVLLQAALFPLTYKSLKAGAAMRKLQPQIAKLQQRYAKEPARLNQEMMELYKKSGANPLGGCLPMLIQMPVFIALYNVLRNSWELHGATWLLWVKDLSAHDPWYVLPLIMGGLMYVQNSFNPQSGDPTQAMMMKMMPVIFTVMFLKFPAGLVLYWLTNSVVSVIQQLALKDHFEKALQS